MKRFLLILMLVSVLAQSKGQDKYFPDGTRWCVVMCKQIKGYETLYAIVDFDTTPEYKSVVNGDSVVYNVLRTWDDGKVAERQIYKKVIISKLYYNNIRTESDVALIREQGDSIFLCSEGKEELVYDFSDWHEGKEMPGGMAIGKLTNIKLNDGNTYDYWADGQIIRYIGGLQNGIIPRFEPVGGDRIWQLAHFIRNNVVIYDNLNIIYDESGATSMPHRYAEDSPSSRYTLHGMSISAGSQRNSGIYIKNGRKYITK